MLTQLKPTALLPGFYVSRMGGGVHGRITLGHPTLQCIPSGRGLSPKLQLGRQLEEPITVSDPHSTRGYRLVCSHVWLFHGCRGLKLGPAATGRTSPLPLPAYVPTAYPTGWCLKLCYMY